MAERKATNKYYPSDWDPKKGSINKYRNSHPLRDRARKLDQGILIIRFEMPYNIWCDGCNNHIGMGVRYNAEKSRAGNYYTTPIYKFRMKCHLCDNHFEMQTDPAKLDYAILNGARRQERRWDPADNEQICHDKEESKRIAIDAMYKLERQAEDKIKAESTLVDLEEIQKLQSRWSDEFKCNRLVRRQFRERREQEELVRQKDAKLLAKSFLDIKLAPESSRDTRKAIKIFSKSRPRTSISSQKKMIFESSILPTRIGPIIRKPILKKPAVELLKSIVGKR